MRKILWLCIFLGYSSAIYAQDEFSILQYKLLDNYQESVNYVQFSPNSTYFSINTRDNKLELFDRKWNKVWTHHDGNPENFAGETAFSPDEKYMAFTRYMSRGDIAILSLKERKVIQRLRGHSRSTAAIGYSPDGKFLISTGSDRKIMIWKWNKNKFELSQTFENTHEKFQHFYALDFSGDGKFVAITGITGEILILENKKGKWQKFQSIPIRAWDYALTFHPTEKSFCQVTSYELVTWTLEGKEFVKKQAIRVKGGKAWDAVFTHKGDYLVTGTAQGSFIVYQWNKAQLEEYDQISIHQKDVFSLHFSPDGNFMASCGADKTARIWTTAQADLSKLDAHTKGDEKDKEVIQKLEDEGDLAFDTDTERSNYLLVVGINEYKYWNPLTNATRDAKDVKEVLQEKYGFIEDNIFEIYNKDATAKGILTKIEEVRKKLTTQDNLLIYFSGHGHYNNAIEEGFWIPVDAHKGEETEYLANSTLLKYIKSIPAKHIFLVADACFSGSLFSTGSRGYVENVERFKSRWGLASGRLEFVSDGTKGKNSPFAGYFIKYLKENQKKRFPVSELVNYVKVAVANNSDQTPVGNPLKSVGDEGGEFIFYLKK